MKTVTIDLEAYETLSRRKQPGSVLSDVIKRELAGGSTGRDLLKAARRIRVSDDTLQAIEVQVRARRRSRARVPRW